MLFHDAIAGRADAWRDLELYKEDGVTIAVSFSQTLFQAVLIHYLDLDTVTR